MVSSRNSRHSNRDVGGKLQGKYLVNDKIKASKVLTIGADGENTRRR